MVITKSISSHINENVYQDSSTNDINNSTIYTIIVYEHKTKTLTGIPCNIQVKVDLSKDIRFANKDWIKCFNRFAGKLSEKEFVELLKWMQAITKLSAFI